MRLHVQVCHNPMQLGIVMDAIEQIAIHKDSSFAMLLEAQRRGYHIFYMEQNDLRFANGKPMATTRRITVKDDSENRVEFAPQQEIALGDLDILLMRKDPPFNMEYIYDTYVLEAAQQEGVLVVNSPQALRDANEKMFTLQFPDFIPPTVVTRDITALRSFAKNHGDIVIKPLDGMGGASIFRTHAQDQNFNVIGETLTLDGQRYAMAQKFIPEIKAGDKRILLVDGVPVDYALARIPAADDFRGNLARGGRGEAVSLTDHDRKICAAIGPRLRDQGLWFVGLDVIGQYVTEINVTSPTCIRELDAACGLNIAGTLFDTLESRFS